MADSITFVDPTFADHRTQRFSLFRKSNKFIDCRIVASEEAIPCHALIISAASPVLETMIESELTEGLSGELNFPTLDPESMVLLVDYMYTGSISVQKDQVLDIVQMCDYLQLTGLRDYLLQFVTEVVTPDNVVGWLQLTSLFNMHELTVRCRRMLLYSIKQVSQCSDFTELAEAEMKILLQEASRVSLPMGDVLGAVFLWIQHDILDRIHILDTPLGNIKQRQCEAHVMQSLQTQFASILEQKPEFLSQFVIVQQDKRTLLRSLTVIGGYENMRCWTLSDGQFKAVAQIPEDIFAQYQSICQYEAVGLILTAGLNSTTCAMYNTTTKQWSRLTDLDEPRRRHASACIYGKVIIIGGYHSNCWSNTVQILDLEAENTAWVPTTPVPAILESPKSACLPWTVCVMGDHNPTLFSFDVVSNTWSVGNTMHCDPGSDFSIAAGNGKIHIAGGSRNILCIYNLILNSWSQVSPPIGMHQNGAMFFHPETEKLLLLGGSFSDIVEEYDSEKDTPYKLPTMLHSHFAFMVLSAE